MSDDGTPARVAMCRSLPERANNYRNYTDVLRADCWYSCAYCSITEAEASGIGFQIDHYDPMEPDRALYTNLFWACAVCNRNKSDFWNANVNPHYVAYHVIRIDQHHPHDHFRLNELTVEPLTEIGEATDCVLMLNRKALRELRAARRDLQLGQQLIMEGIRALYGSPSSLSHLSPESRRSILAMRGQLSRQVDVICSTLTQLVESVARSPLLDPDPEAEKHRRVRRDFINDVNGLGPDTTASRRAARRLRSAQ